MPVLMTNLKSEHQSGKSAIIPSTLLQSPHKLVLRSRVNSDGEPLRSSTSSEREGDAIGERFAQKGAVASLYKLENGVRNTMDLSELFFHRYKYLSI